MKREKIIDQFFADDEQNQIGREIDPRIRRLRDTIQFMMNQPT